MTKLTLKADKRKATGRKVKKLRREGILPGNIYGKKIESEAVQIDAGEFMKVYQEAGETGLVELTIDSKKRNVLIHNVQLDPVTDKPLHIDLLQVDLKEKVSAEVPVELVGESPAEKQGLGTVVQYITEVEVLALPGDLPDKFEIDATALTEVDQSILVENLPIDPQKIEVKADPKEIVLKVEPPKKEEEVVTPPVEEQMEGEAKAPTEGEGEPKKEEAPEEEGKTKN